MKQQPKKRRRSWASIFFVLLLVCLACGRPWNERCPRIPSGDADISECCEVLDDCCTRLSTEEDKKNCTMRVNEQAPTTCQALYQEFFSNEKC